MGDHPNVELVRGLIEGFNDRDEEVLRSALAEDVQWHMIGGDTVVGVQAMEEQMGVTPEDFSITADVHDVVGNEDHVVALVNAKVEAGDQSFEYRTAEILHVKDGKVTERWAFSDDTAAITEFFSQLG